jgi:hypothetical protein
MKSSHNSLFTGLAIGAAFVCFAQSASAQAGLQVTPPSGIVPGAAAGGAAPAIENMIRIRSLTDLKDIPQRVTPLGNRSGKQKYWGVFDAVFDTTPDWLDEVTVTYTVILQNPRPKQGEKPMSLYTLTVDYADVASGRDHKVGAVLPPAALLRYGAPIGFAAQFSIGGRPAGELGVPNVLNGAQKWWSNSAVLNSPQVQKRDGLMERGKSPFALVDIDNYEVAK